MVKPEESRQIECEFVSIDELILEHPLFRLIDQFIDFSFLLEKVSPFYSDDHGRPTDPLIFLKMMFIGNFYGIRSERKLEREMRRNVAYRWFLGLKFNDSVPHHSTISWNRQQRFKNTTIFQEIFEDIVLLAMNHTMVADVYYFQIQHT